jgi:ribose/xylose/arabinose/galactoside ABC-type transport system permease subunit
MTAAPLTGGISAARPADIALRAFVALLVVVVLVGAVTTDGFVSAANLKAILAASAFVGTIAVGATVIMLGGSLFSLSLGTTTAVTAILFLYALQWGVVTALVLTLVAGAIVFALQGAIVGSIGANPIIVTIGAGALQEGITTWRQAGNITAPANVDIDFLAATVFGLPVSFFVFVAVAVVVDLFMRRTRRGRQIYLMGENSPAARAAGIPVAWLTTLGFTIAGACVAITGILVAGFNQVSNIAISGTFTFDAIAAVLVGGSSVTGGSGSVARTVGGTLVIAAISDMLLLRGASTGMQVLVKGLIVVIVVVLVQLARREARAT